MKVKISVILLLICSSVAGRSQSWREIVLPVPYGVTDGAFTGNTGNVIAGLGYIIHTDDYFQTYNIDSEYLGQTPYSISFPSKNIGFISAGLVRGGILKTTDGGATWNPLSTGPQGNLDVGDVIQFLNADTGFGIIDEIGYIDIMHDTGIIDTELAIGLPCAIARDVWFLNTRLGYVLCGNITAPPGGAPVILKTIDGGYTWQNIAIINQWGLADFCILDDSTILVAADSYVFKSTDTGRTFDTVLIDPKNEGGGVKHSIAFAVHDTGYVTFAEQVYRSCDAGNTWALTDFAINTDSDEVVFLRAASATQAIVGTNRGRLYITDNGGGTATGVNNISLSGDLSIYPNPCTHYLQGFINSEIANTTYQITSTDGRMVQAPKPVRQKHFQTDVSQLASGIYFLTLQNENERVVRKFVKSP